ncbi:hypothetical protein [Nocardia sp. NPDC049149]|uniref:hypothetical protein n=1 Tax=Nocardia sp. NPDC049149 TaxID=3364315 RepID=UPI00371705F3
MLAAGAMSAVSAAALVSGLAAAPAQAAPGDLTCRGTATVDFKPGVTFNAAATSISGTAQLGVNADPATACTSTTGKTMTGGTFVLDPVTTTASCAATKARGTGRILWNNGNSPSRVTWAVDFSVFPPQRSFMVMVASGPLAGDTATFDVTPSSQTGDCSTGLTQLVANNITATFR